MASSNNRESNSTSSDCSKESSSTEILQRSVNTANVRNYNTIDPQDSTRSSNSATLMTSQVMDDERAQPPPETKRQSSCSYYQKGSTIEHAVYFFALAVASYAGVVIRIYLSQLARWNGVPLFPALTAEVVGTAIMGFIGAHKRSLATNHKALYQAIATGLCGSITTFSSWNSEAVKVLLQINQDQPNNVTRIIGWVTTLILGVGMPIAALLFGRHLAHLSRWSDFSSRRENEQQYDPSISKILVVLENVAFTLAWILLTGLALFITYHLSKFKIMFSLIFASVGAYVRWHLAPLNSLFTNFKLGTFIVNVGGSWLLGATLVATAYLSQQLGAQHLGVMLLSGFGIGFCGCLTTVSTFAVELTSLSLGWSYVYAFGSIFSAQVGLVIIRGAYEWSG